MWFVVGDRGKTPPEGYRLKMLQAIAPLSETAEENPSGTPAQTVQTFSPPWAKPSLEDDTAVKSEAHGPAQTLENPLDFLTPEQHFTLRIQKSESKLKAK